MGLFFEFIQINLTNPGAKIVNFQCPICDMQLKAEPELAGKVVRCPGCNTKLEIPSAEQASATPPSPSGVPAPTGAKTPATGASQTPARKDKPKERTGWEETDPSNPNMLISFGIGLGAAILFVTILLQFKAPAGTPTSQLNAIQYAASLWGSQLIINFVNTFFFSWAITILVMKFQKLKRQRQAMLLDVLPEKFGNKIDEKNVGKFIDNLYSLPETLRDSIMVNRIRKALELFEGCQDAGDVVHLMGTQSDTDANRAQASFSYVKAFVWAIPIVGFAGTVIGLSQALMSLNFDNLDDISSVVASLKGVINGLGGAFDSTLVGLSLVLLLNFPMNAMIKAEDDTLNSIDTFCNEVLIPRLNDGQGPVTDEPGMVNQLVKLVTSAQQEFLSDLNTLSATVNEQAYALEQRAAEHQQRVSAEFAMALDRLREEVSAAIADSVRQTTEHTTALAEGIGSLNKLLADLGEKQVVINQTVKKGWFSRS